MCVCARALRKRKRQRNRGTKRNRGTVRDGRYKKRDIHTEDGVQGGDHWKVAPARSRGQFLANRVASDETPVFKDLYEQDWSLDQTGISPWGWER